MRLVVARTLPVVALALLAACHSVPERNVPEDVIEALPEAFTNVAPVAGELETDWWTAFSDHALDALVARGLANNADLAVGAARLLEAEAFAREAGAARWPRIGLFASGTRARTQAITQPGATGETFIAESGQYGVSASYEVDLWGRLQATSAAARQRYLSEGYTLASLRIAIAAELVRGYLTLQSLDAQRAVLEESAEVLGESLRLARRRFELGNISDLDVQRATAELEDSRAQLAIVTRQARAARRAVLTLAGEMPTGAAAASLPITPEGAEPHSLPVVPVGLPAALVTRRPDLRAAEAGLAAAAADLSAARRALFPTLSITASAGEAAAELSELFNNGFSVWSIGAELFASVFEGGRKRATIDAADARRMQVLERYRDTVRRAFREVLDALDARTSSAEVYRARSEQVEALERSVHLAQRKYDEGYSAFIDVLDARRTLLSARLAVADARAAAAAAYVDLAVAVGGGWEDAP